VAIYKTVSKQAGCLSRVFSQKFPPPVFAQKSALYSDVSHRSVHIQCSMRHHFSRMERRRFGKTRLEPRFSTLYLFHHGQYHYPEIVHHIGRAALACVRTGQHPRPGDRCTEAHDPGLRHRALKANAGIEANLLNPRSAYAERTHLPPCGARERRRDGQMRTPERNQGTIAAQRYTKSLPTENETDKRSVNRSDTRTLGVNYIPRLQATER
jgi:hypothetical protein